MLENFLIVAAQVAVLFLLMGVGLVCRRVRVLDDASIAGLVRLLVLVVTPCLIVDAFQRPFDRSMLSSLALAVALAFGMHALLIALAVAAVRRAAARALPVLRLAVVFSNAGFMGIPLEQAILGSRGVFFGIVYVAAFNCFMWTWGLMSMQGARIGVSPVRVLVNPGTVGLAFGLPLFLFSISLPGPVHVAVSGLAALNTPLAMVAIGYYLGGVDLRGFLTDARAWGVSLLRLLVAPALLVAILLVLRRMVAVDRDMAVALVVAASAPVAAMTSMFAAKYDRDVDLASALVSGTTLLSMATMPPIVAFALSLF